MHRDSSVADRGHSRRGKRLSALTVGRKRQIDERRVRMLQISASIRHSLQSAVQQKPDLIGLLESTIMLALLGITVVSVTLCIELNIYLTSDRSVADLNVSICCFFGGCQSPSSGIRRFTILSLWPIWRVLIICFWALWKRHQPPNWTCVVQTQIKHLAVSISPWVLSAY